MPTVSRDPGLGGFNALSPPEARAALLACCASRVFATRVAEHRPYGGARELVAEAESVIDGLSWPDVLEALGAHPRIGERARGTGREAAWSSREQSGIDAAGRDVLTALAEGNAAYEERFGHVYLICATGLGATEMLERLRARLTNDAESERRVVRGELIKITRLRLARLLEDAA